MAIALYCSILLLTYSKLSGALGSPDLLPSCSTISLELHNTTILIITHLLYFNHTLNQQIYKSTQVPYVGIASPDTLGPCDSLMLDLSSSTGNGGREWESVSIVVSSTGTTQNTSIVQNFVNLDTYSINPPSVIPPSVLQKGVSYNFEITLCSFLSACGQANKRLTVREYDGKWVMLGI